MGLSFYRNVKDATRKTPTANEASVTHQKTFELDALQDRANKYLTKTSDDGWLCGGGNGPLSFLLPHIDSAHLEIAHPGTFARTGSRVHPDLSSYLPPRPTHVTGIGLMELVSLLAGIDFHPIEVVPTGVAFTATDEFQLRFDPTAADGRTPANPALTTLYENVVNALLNVQVLDKGDPFHVSMCRETKFCCQEDRSAFAKLTAGVVDGWIERGAVVLNQGVAQYGGDMAVPSLLYAEPAPHLLRASRARLLPMQMEATRGDDQLGEPDRRASTRGAYPN